MHEACFFIFRTRSHLQGLHKVATFLLLIEFVNPKRCFILPKGPMPEKWLAFPTSNFSHLGPRKAPAFCTLNATPTVLGMVALRLVLQRGHYNKIQSFGTATREW